MTCASVTTTLTPSSAEPFQSSPDSVSMQAASPNDGGMKPFAVSNYLNVLALKLRTYLQHHLPQVLQSYSINSCKATLQLKVYVSYVQTRTVHTTWNSWSVAVLVLIAALTLMPARHATYTAMMAAVALLVSKHILQNNHDFSHVYCINYDD